jgi:hypothetical protein
MVVFFAQQSYIYPPVGLSPLCGSIPQAGFTPCHRVRKLCWHTRPPASLKVRYAGSIPQAQVLNAWVSCCPCRFLGFQCFLMLLNEGGAISIPFAAHSRFYRRAPLPPAAAYAPSSATPQSRASTQALPTSVGVCGKQAADLRRKFHK